VPGNLNVEPALVLARHDAAPESKLRVADAEIQASGCHRTNRDVCSPVGTDRLSGFGDSEVNDAARPRSGGEPIGPENRLTRATVGG